MSRAKNAGKLVGRWSLIEGLAIFAAADVLARLHRRDLFIAAVAVIVGLHFLPLARGLPAKPYYATGSALVVVGLVGTVVPPATRPLLVGFGAALVLWTTMVALTLRATRQASAAA